MPAAKRRLSLISQLPAKLALLRVATRQAALPLWQEIIYLGGEYLYKNKLNANVKQQSTQNKDDSDV